MSPQVPADHERPVARHEDLAPLVVSAAHGQSFHCPTSANVVQVPSRARRQAVWRSPPSLVEPREGVTTMQTLSTTIFAAWHHDGPGPWIVFVPLFWIVVIGGIVLLLRSRGGWGPPQVHSQREPRSTCSTVATRGARSTTTNTASAARCSPATARRRQADRGRRCSGARRSRHQEHARSDRHERRHHARVGLTRARKSATWSAWEMTLSTTSRPGCASTRRARASNRRRRGVRRRGTRGRRRPSSAASPRRRRACAARRARPARPGRGSRRVLVRSASISTVTPSPPTACAASASHIVE